MQDLRLNSEGDLDINNFSFRLTLNNTDAIKQKLRIKLRLFLGEFFLDTSKGLPFFEKIFVKNPNLSEIDFIIKEQILTTENIKELTDYSTTFDKALRKYTVNFRAVLTDGSIIELSEVL